MYCLSMSTLHTTFPIYFEDTPLTTATLELPIIMQTVNQVIDSASKAIWGDKISQQQQEQHGSEPVSGVTGKGTATDPYDAGNREGT